MTERQSNYMHLFSGSKFYPFEPRLEDVQLIDIAHSLANKPRYNGHTRFPISVAQHSIYTALVDVPGYNTYQDRLERLMHDAAEYVTGDLIRPLKYSEDFAVPFKRVESLNEPVVASRFNLAYPFRAHVKTADEMVTTAEVRQLINKDPGLVFDKPLHDESKVADIVIDEWTWRQARCAFINMFNALTLGTAVDELANCQIDMGATDILKRLQVPSDEELRSYETSVNND